MVKRKTLGQFGDCPPPKKWNLFYTKNKKSWSSNM